MPAIRGDKEYSVKPVPLLPRLNWDERKSAIYCNKLSLYTTHFEIKTDNQTNIHEIIKV